MGRSQRTSLFNSAASREKFEIKQRNTFQRCNKDLGSVLVVRSFSSWVAGTVSSDSFNRPDQIT